MPGAFVIEADNIPELANCIIGQTTSKFIIETTNESIDLAAKEEVYNNALRAVYPTNKSSGSKIAGNLYKSANRTNTLNKTPVAFVPLFPGTSGEYEVIAQLKNAGARVVTQVIMNQNVADLEQSMKFFAENAAISNIIVLPGGSVMGDEPQREGTYTSLFLSNPKIQKAVISFNQRGGIIIGFGSGFVSLVQTGLLPYGEFRSADKIEADFGLNSSGRHCSVFRDVRVVSNKAVFIPTSELENEYKLPVSTKYTSFYISDSIKENMEQNGQVIISNTDNTIDAITSPEGKIYGQTSLPYLVKEGLYKNIDNIKTFDVLKYAVKYFM